ncbi:solute carrier family 2, facilitated glucose transporter member 12-like isoform X2 [Tachypleus tridentatus]|uniref:solute carrier family 2, facilitated glucose transporter member 12-like isoform X2 n=1 Tax=Tachypleus tridentatus TaxID=6853 RepID=UPI003FD3A1AB
MVIKMEEGNSDEDLPEDLPNRFVTTSLDVRDKNSGLSKMPRKFLLFAAVTASVGGVMFGYDVGIISGALLQLKLEFQLNCVWQELVVSSLLCGAFLASLVGGIIVDHYGRRMSMVFAGFLFITGSVLLCFSPTIFLVLVGRFVLGFSVSLSVTAECTYISELSTPKHRGMLVSLNEVGITFGFLLAFLVNYIFISVPQGWKYMFGLAAVPAVLQLVGIIFLPRSPHYLLMIGKKEEAAAVLNKVSPGEDTSKQIGSIQRDLSQQKMITYCQLCSSVNNMSVRMVIGMNLVFLQQFTGQTNVLYYAPLIFRQVGYTSNEGATLAALGLGIIKVVAAIVSMLLIDKLGRRVILLTGVLVMTVSIWFLGFVLTFDPVHQVVIQCMETPVYHQFTLHNESEDNSTVLPAHFNVITPTLLPKTLIAQNVSLKKTLSLDLLDVYNSSGLPHNFVPAYMHLNHTVDTNSSPPNLPTKDQVFYETDINRDFLMVRQGYPIQAHLQTHQTVLPSLEKFCL